MNLTIEEIRKLGLEYVTQHNYGDAIIMLMKVLSVDSSYYPLFFDLRSSYNRWLEYRLIGLVVTPDTVVQKKLLQLLNGISEKDLQLDLNMYSD